MNETLRVPESGGQPDKGFEALHALYENKQQWVRHYETLLAQITPISTTASLAIAAYVADTRTDSRIDYLVLCVPAVLICFTLWFNWWCDSEIRRQFEQIVLAEIGMGFYHYEVAEKQILPDSFRTSPAKTRPIILAGYALQCVSALIVTAILVAAV